MWIGNTPTNQASGLEKAGFLFIVFITNLSESCESLDTTEVQRDRWFIKDHTAY